MFKLRNILMAPALLAAALFCTSLTAQEFKVAVNEPGGSEELREEQRLVKDQFSTTITGTRGFQLFTRSNIEGIIGEHQTVRMSGLYNPDEARVLGEFKGADYLIFSELSMLQDGAIRIVAQAVDIVTARVAGSGNKLVEYATSKMIMDACQDLMTGLLLQVKINKEPSAANAEVVVSGLEGELHRMVMGSRANPKWTKNKEKYSLEVDLGGVDITENAQYGTLVVRGRVTFIVTDEETGNSSVAEFDLKQFTEMGKDRVHRLIKEQVQPKVNNIIRDLLEGLD